MYMLPLKSAWWGKWDCVFVWAQACCSYMRLTERDCLHTGIHPLWRGGPQDRPRHFSCRDNSWSCNLFFFFFFGCAVGWWCCLEQVMGVYSYPCKHICVSTHVRFWDRCVSKLACKCVYTGACINMCDVYVCVHTLWINMGVSVHLCVTLSVSVWWKLCVIHVSMQEAGFLYMCFLHVYRRLPICGWGFSITRSAVSFSTDQ